MQAEVLDRPVGPPYLPGVVQRRETAVAEHGEHAGAVGDGRRRGVAVLRAFGGRDLAEHFPVPEEPSRSPVQAKDVAGSPLVGRRRDEDAVAVDDRRRTAFAGEGRFPGDVFGGAPPERQVGVRVQPLTGRAAEPGPIAGPQRGREGRDQHQDVPTWQPGHRVSPVCSGLPGSPNGRCRPCRPPRQGSGEVGLIRHTFSSPPWLRRPSGELPRQARPKLRAGDEPNTRRFPPHPARIERTRAYPRA